MLVLEVRKKFGEVLKSWVASKAPREKIGVWTFSFYWENMAEVSDELRETLITIHTMEMGEQFFFSYEELDKIADDLIAGKDVKL